MGDDGEPLVCYLEWALRMKKGNPNLTYPPQLTPQGKYLCFYCPRRFDNDKTCYNHMQNYHVNGSGFRCNVCGYTAKKSDQVKHHIVMSHDEVRDVKGSIKTPDQTQPLKRQNDPGSSSTSPKKLKLTPENGTPGPYPEIKHANGSIEIDLTDSPLNSPAPTEILEELESNEFTLEPGNPVPIIVTQPRNPNEPVPSSESTPTDANDKENVPIAGGDTTGEPATGAAHDSDTFPSPAPGISNSILQSISDKPLLKSKPKKHVRFLEVDAGDGEVQVQVQRREYSGLEYNYLKQMVLGKIKVDAVDADGDWDMESEMREQYETDEPFIELRKGNFNKSFWFDSIEFENWGSLGSWGISGLKTFNGALLYATPDVGYLPIIAIHGMLESVGLLDKCYDGLRIELEVENPEQAGQRKITTSLIVLADLDSLENRITKSTEMKIERIYSGNQLVSISTNQILHEPEDWPDILKNQLKVDIPHPRLMYMTESNIRWLMDQKDNWMRMLDTYNFIMNFSDTNFDLYQKRNSLTANSQELSSINFQIAKTETMMHRFKNVYKEFMKSEGMEGEIFYEFDDNILLYWVKPRDKVRRIPNDPDAVEALMGETDPVEKRTAAIAFFFSFWSIMDTVPFLVCDLLNEESINGPEYIPISGIEFYIKNLVTVKRHVNSTQQLFFTSPFNGGIRTGGQPKLYKTKPQEDVVESSSSLN